MVVIRQLLMSGYCCADTWQGRPAWSPAPSCLAVELGRSLSQEFAFFSTAVRLRNTVHFSCTMGSSQCDEMSTRGEPNLGREELHSYGLACSWYLPLTCLPWTAGAPMCQEMVGPDVSPQRSLGFQLLAALYRITSFP